MQMILNQLQQLLNQMTFFDFAPRACFMLSIKSSALRYPFHKTRGTKPASLLQLLIGHDTFG